MPAKPSAPPPSIAHLKAQGLAGVCPFCRACCHSGAITFDAIGLPDVTRQKCAPFSAREEQTSNSFWRFASN